jgi:ABC-2 type transport system ATP-binding protein
MSRCEEEYYILALDEYSQLEQVMAALRTAGSQVLEMQVFQPDLEEVFVKIMEDVEIREAVAVPVT